MNEDVKNKRDINFGSSIWPLLAANLIVIVWAVWKSWSFEWLFQVYIFQNLILGIFWVVKVIESPIDGSYTKKVKSIIAFLPMYFVAHTSIFVLLYKTYGEDFFIDIKQLLAVSGVFFVSETISYLKDKVFDRRRRLSLGAVQLFPYARIAPMYLVMFSGIALESKIPNSQRFMIAFLLVKAFGDVAMYLVERYYIFDNLVTDLLANTIEDDFLSNLLKEKEKGQVCGFCQRTIGSSEKPQLIKENVVCEICYRKIEIEKKGISE